MSGYLKQEDLAAWIDALSEENAVLAPQSQGNSVVFAPYAKGASLVLDRDATTSPKKSVFPQSETLMNYAFKKDPEDLTKVDLEVTEAPAPKSTVVFGCRPCGARGFLAFDRVYYGKTVTDVPYLRRRQTTAFITLACAAPENTCFCHWVGSGPDDADGSDVMLTPVEGGYFAKAVTEKGEALLAKATLSSDSGKESEAATVVQKCKDALGEAPDLSTAPARLLERFDDMAFWDAMSSKCISCGACTYLCPTCYCFTITDEACGSSGSRIRSWDNCMSFQFTLEASGHNPRPTKAHRLKNRVGHKFSYYPNIHDGNISCCGCGRCIKSCPSSVDIREIVLSAMKPSQEAAND